MYYHREIENELQKYIPQDEVIAIVGPRQVGKTTLLKHLYDQLEIEERYKAFLTFEDRRELRLFQDVRDFKDRYKECKYIFIDEFQYASEGGQKLKFLYDSTNIKFVISGSSSLDLKFKTGKYMVGRIFTFHLWPFSFREFLQIIDDELYRMFKERIPNPFENFNQAPVFGVEINTRLEKYCQEYAIWGGYPAVVMAKDSEVKKKKLESIFDSYLLREIKDLLTLATDQELARLTEILALQIGGLLNYDELCRSLGLNYNQLKKHLEILKQTFIIDLIRPFYKNKRTELVKNPEAYFIDTGFRNYRINDFREFNIRNDLGALIENVVFLALKRSFSNAITTSIKYWRTKNKAEVDFVVDTTNLIIPFEVKYSNKPTPGKSFYSFLKKYRPPKAFILTRGYTEITEIDQTQIIYIPVYYL